MRVTGFISILTAAVLTASCMAMQYEPTMDNVAPKPAIVGNVTDTSGVAIEHIKVTLDWNDGAFSETQYTNSDGVFTAEIWENVEKAVRSLTVTLEDIDGEENGGTFESLSETFTVFEENSVTILDFRLNRATASESSPQS